MTPRNDNFHTRAIAILQRLPAGPLVGVEIGVFCGQTSAFLLEHRKDLSLYMVDSWAPTPPDTPYALTQDPHTEVTQEEHDDFLEQSIDAVARFWPRSMIRIKSSAQAAAQFNPASLDFVFLDGDHSYAGVVADIDAWRDKVKPGGLLCGHDYYADGCERPFPRIEVRRAVDEFAARVNLPFELGEDMTWFMRMP